MFTNEAGNRICLLNKTMKRKHFLFPITGTDVLDVHLVIEKRKIVRFALNYRALIKEVWHEIYRIDNFHGLLHEHKFWREDKPVHLENKDKLLLDEVVDKYVDIIIKSHEKFRLYYEQKREKKHERKKFRKKVKRD